MKKLIISLLFLVLIPLACTRAPNLEQRILQMVAAHNQHNVTKELTFYADSALLFMAGWNPAVGKAVLRDVFECDSVLNCELVFKDFVVRGDTVIVNSFTERNEFFRLAGLSEVRYMPGTRITFGKGLIQKVEVPHIVPEDAKALNEFSSGLTSWLRAEHPDLMKEFFESIELSKHNGKSAQLWVKLLTEYQASKSSEHK